MITATLPEPARYGRCVDDPMNALKMQQRFSPALAPLGLAYGLAMRARRAMWGSLLARFNCPCACVSIGNISWGGTGKTPLVEWLMHWAVARKLRAAVLTRGYGAVLQRPPVMVSPRHSARDVGDEPLMLALSCPQVPVIVDPNRRRGARSAIVRLSPDLIFLDDGFQHIPLHRDLDLVLLRPEDLHEHWNRVIPAGSWREPHTALRHAGAFLIKCDPATMHALAPAMAHRLEEFGKPVFSFSLRPTVLRQVGGDREVTPGELDNRPYVLVTGVGQPEQVKRTVTAYMGYAPQQTFVRPDHHRYTFKEVDRLVSTRHLVICTAKDAVKLRIFPAPNIWYLHTELEFGPALWTDEAFPAWWDNWWTTVGALPRRSRPR